MFIETSATVLRSQLAAHLVNFMLNPDDTALDIIELIALRMRTREDYQVAVLGFFVRANLLYLEKGIVSFCEVLERLTVAAVNAPRGHDAFTQALNAAVGRYSA